MRLRAPDVRARLTGLSTPLAGATWEYRDTDARLARRAVTFLEDRRVLYVPSECELPRYCVESVLEIRRHLTGLLEEAAGREPLDGHLRAIRAAGRKFLDIVGADVGTGRPRPIRVPGGTSEWVFNQALGELRGVVGVHVALLADRYQLDLEEGLAAIVPARTDD